MTTLSRERIAALAALGRLDLDADTLDAMKHDLERILELAEQLEALDLDDIEATTHPIPLQISLREDGPPRTLPTPDALRAAPDTRGDYFAVPRVVES